MRIVDLHCGQVGHWRKPFTLALGEGLNLILGDNEAGKSTLRRALAAFLFGPEQALVAPRSVGSFDMTAQLKVDGSAQGLQRKGRNWVESPAASLQELLSPALAGRFRDLFCLGHEHLLPEDSQRFLEADGALGSLLFGLGSGLKAARLLEARKQVQERLRRAQSSSARGDGLGLLLERYAQVLARHRSLARFEGYDAAAATLTRAEEREASCRLALDRLRGEHTRLRKLHEGAPLLQQRRQLAREQHALLDGQQLPAAGQAQALARLLHAYETAATELQDRQRSEQDARAALTDVAQPGPLLELASERQELESRVERLRDGRAELEDADRLHQQGLAQLRQQLDRLIGAGPGEPLQRAARLLRPQTLQSELRKLIEQDQALAQEWSRCRQSIEQARSRQQTAEQQLQAMGEPDCEAVETALRHARRAALLEQTAGQLEAEIERSRRQVAELLQRLALRPGVEATGLASLLPEPATAELREAAWRSALQALAAAEQAEAISGRELAQRHAVVAALRAEIGDPPGAAQLDAALAQREQCWEALQSCWTPRIDPAQSTQIAALAARFREALRQVDLLVARRMQAAQSLGQLLAAQVELAQAQATASQTASAVERLRAERDASEAAWTALWPFLREAPASAASWFERYSQWRDHDAELGKRAQRLRHDRADAATARGEALAALRDGVPDLERIDSMDALVAALEAEKQAREQQREQSRACRIELQRSTADLTQAHAEAAGMAARRAQWQEQWEALLPELPEQIGTRPAALAAWLEELPALRERHAQLLQALGQGEERLRRAELTQRALSDFLDRASRLDPGVTLAPEEDLLAAWGRVSRRIDEAVGRAHRLQDALRQVEASEQEARRAADRLAQLGAQLDALWQELGQARPWTTAAIATWLAVDAKVAELGQAIRQLDAQLAGCWGSERAAFEASLGEDGEAGLADAIAALELRMQEAKAEHQASQRALLEAETGLRRLEQEQDALAVEQAYSDARERVLTKAGEVQRLRLAQAILDLAHERASAGDERLTARASGYLGMLTERAWTGLRIDRDNPGSAQLLAIDRHGEESTPAQLSTGTREQLWMALRLAAVVEAAQETPYPLLLDDVFVQFDDVRSTAALRLLAEISREMQVIVFTHHEHLLDLAGRALAADSYQVSILPSPDSAERRRVLPLERERRQRRSALEPQQGEEQPADPKGQARSSEELVLAILGQASTPLSRNEILAAAESQGIDLETSWARTIQTLIESRRVQRSGVGRGSRYGVGAW